MSNSQDWSLKNRLQSALGLLIGAAIFGSAAWWLARGTSAAKTDLETFKNNARIAGDVSQSLAVFGFGTILTGGIAALCVIGAVVVLLMKGPDQADN